MPNAPRFAVLALLPLVTVGALLFPTTTQTQSGGSPFDRLHFRDIGPAATSGRIHDVQIDPKDPAVLYVGTASGGIWKTTDAGIHWAPIFDSQDVSSIGALAVAPSNASIVWAGTGEPFIRSHISVGNGVYKPHLGRQRRVQVHPCATTCVPHRLLDAPRSGTRRLRS